MQPSFKLGLIASAAVFALTACGGGGDAAGSAAAPAGAGNTVATLKLNGTAATGAAIPNAPVQAKCASGSGSATSAADGSFTIEIAGGALPCVLEVRPASGAALHASLDGSGAGSATVNITPLTELVAGRVAGASANDLFANFDATARAKVTPAAVDAAIAAIASSLKGAVDLTGLNPMRDALVAADGANLGNTHDQKLDALKAALAAARITLPEIGAALATDTGSTAHVATLMNPATASCAGYRSGKYVILSPHEVGHDASRVAHRVSVDAGRLSFVDEADSARTVRTLTADAASPCKFSLPGDYGTVTLLVSPSGLAVANAASANGTMRTSIVVPEQALPVADLAGAWNVIGFGHGTATAPLEPLTATLSIDAAGKFTATAECDALTACVAVPGPFQGFVPNANGGFDFGSARAFAFKTASGKVSMLMVDKDTGSLVVAVKQAPLALPAVGDVARFWDFGVASSGLTSAVTDFVTTVRTVDTAANAYTRERASDGRVDGFTIDKPRTGLRYRASGTALTRTGTTVSLSELIAMPLPGTGISVYTSLLAGQYSLGVSVTRP
jgi:hypothetical protein